MTEADIARDTLGHLRYIKVPLGDYMSLAQRAKGKRHSEEPKEMRWFRNGFWGATATFCGAGLVLTTGRIEGWFSPDTSVIVWSIALTLLSSVFAVVVQMTINKKVFVAEIRDARPADTVALGEMTAEIQANRELIQRQREEMAANELQRQSDVEQIREASGKRLKEIGDQVERLAAGIELAVLKAQEKAYAAGIAYALDAVSEKVSSHIGPLLAEVVALKEVQKDLERDLAAVILRQQQGQAGGGANIIDIRQARPDAN